MDATELAQWKWAGIALLYQLYARCVLQYVGTRWFVVMKHAMMEIDCSGMAVVLDVKLK